MLITLKKYCAKGNLNLHIGHNKDYIDHVDDKTNMPMPELM